ncbi:MAG: multicopper oxidase domain-containing protein [Desulfovibrionaceae bacterium]
MISRRSFLQFLLISSAITTLSKFGYSSTKTITASFPIKGFNATPFEETESFTRNSGFFSYMEGSAQYPLNAVYAAQIPEEEEIGTGTSLLWYSKVQGRYAATPIVSALSGSTLSIIPSNKIYEPISLYITGLKTPLTGRAAAKTSLLTNDVERVHIPVINPVSTCLYQSLVKGFSGRQNHQGLTGVFLVHDDMERHMMDQLSLEKGITDIPLLIQDKRLDKEGRSIYNPSTNDLLGGYLGNNLSINGTLFPNYNIVNTIYRFRVANGSNARILSLGFRAEGAPIPFTLISSGVGFLEKTVVCNTIMLAPYERADILVDFRNFTKGESIYLINFPFDPMRNAIGYKKDIYAQIEEKGSYCLQLTLTKEIISHSNPLPAVLGDAFSLSRISGPITKKRKFLLQSQIINNQLKHFFETEEKNQEGAIEVSSNQVEEWIFENPVESIPHSIHIPYCTVHLKERSNSPNCMRNNAIDSSMKTATDLGDKDTFIIWPGEIVRLHVKIPTKSQEYNTFLIHTKVLESFDQGMILSANIV